MLERREAVERHPLRSELGDDSLDRDEPVLQSREVGIVAHHAQHTIPLHLLEIESPTCRIANELVSALLEREQQALLTICCTALEKLRDCQRLAGSGRARNERHRVAEKSAAAHLVQ